jgi:hypothetical protein
VEEAATPEPRLVGEPDGVEDVPLATRRRRIPLRCRLGPPRRGNHKLAQCWDAAGAPAVGLLLENAQQPRDFDRIYNEVF